MLPGHRQVQLATAQKGVEIVNVHRLERGCKTGFGRKMLAHQRHLADMEPNALDHTLPLAEHLAGRRIAFLIGGTDTLAATGTGHPKVTALMLSFFFNPEGQCPVLFRGPGSSQRLN
jgi:hypothetical protein